LPTLLMRQIQCQWTKTLQVPPVQASTLLQSRHRASPAPNGGAAHCRTPRPAAIRGRPGLRRAGPARTERCGARQLSSHIAAARAHQPVARCGPGAGPTDACGATAPPPSAAPQPLRCTRGLKVDAACGRSDVQSSSDVLPAALAPRAARPASLKRVDEKRRVTCVWGRQRADKTGTKLYSPAVLRAPFCTEHFRSSAATALFEERQRRISAVVREACGESKSAGSKQAAALPSR